MRAVLALIGVVGGCVPSQSAVFGPVQSDVERRIGVRPVLPGEVGDPRVAEAVALMLRHPLDRDAAIRIAIVNSRRLQAEYDALGIAASRIADATVLGPTQVDIEYKVAIDGPGTEIELDVIQDVLGLFQIPQRRGIAGAELRAARARAVAATVELVANVERAYHAAVAAEQELELDQTAYDAATAAAELLERMHAAGNATDLDLLRERAFREQARLDLARGQVEVELRRETLNGLLGLFGDATHWSIERRLPDLPAEAPAIDDIEREAIASSLDVAALRADGEAAAARLSYARVRMILPELGIGAAATRRDDGEWEVGPALRIGLPLFNWQQGPRRRAHAELRRARNQIAATAVELRAGARAARQRALEAHAEARHLLQVVLPLRQRILDETLLQYNAMNASTFELLQARRDQVDAGRQYIDALRRYWTAMAEIAALRRGVMAASSATSSDRGRNAIDDRGGEDHRAEED